MPVASPIVAENLPQVVAYTAYRAGTGITFDDFSAPDSCRQPDMYLTWHKWFLIHLKHQQAVAEFEQDYLFQKPAYITKLEETAQTLGFEDTVALEVAKSIVAALVRKGKHAFAISQSGEGEIAIHTETPQAYRNLLIDEEGDVDFVLVHNENRANSYHFLFIKSEGLDYDALANLL